MTERVTVLAQLARAIASTSVEEPLPVRLCRAYVDVLGADGGAVTLASTTSRRLTLGTSNGVSAQIEDLQEVLGEGPGQEAYRNGESVVTRVDGFDDQAFPMFSEMAGIVTGPLTVWAFPMHPGTTTIGVITVCRRSGELSYGLDDAQLLADSVGAALLDDPDPNGLMPSAGWSDRARVHQATGMAMAQLGLAPDDAMAILRAHAYAEGTDLTAIVTEVVERRLDLTSLPGDLAPDDGPKEEEP